MKRPATEDDYRNARLGVTESRGHHVLDTGATPDAWRAAMARANEGWERDPSRGGDPIEHADTEPPPAPTLFLVERFAWEGGPLVKSYGPFPKRGTADHVAKLAVEKYRLLGHVVTVTPLDPEEK
jgi:hypothetical protein